MDLTNVKAPLDLLSSLSSQLSLGVLHLEQVGAAVTALIEGMLDINNNTSNNMTGDVRGASDMSDMGASSINDTGASMCIVLDHVDVSDVGHTYGLLTSLLATLINLQLKYGIAVVVITSSPGGEEDMKSVYDLKQRISENIEQLGGRSPRLYEGQSPSLYEGRVSMCVLQVPPLSESDAITLASLFNAPDPPLLAKTGRLLPGAMKSLSALPLAVLASIATNEGIVAPPSKNMTAPLLHSIHMIH
jgi:hypothetical protein